MRCFLRNSATFAFRAVTIALIGGDGVCTQILERGWIGISFVIYILFSVEHTGSKHCPTSMVIMLMNSISFMRIITIASCAMFVSGLFKITEPKIVHSIE